MPTSTFRVLVVDEHPVVRQGVKALLERGLEGAEVSDAPNLQAAVAPGLAEALQQSWVPANPRASGLLNTALILCADHELNVSSFTARCVASAGSTPYAAVIAGLSALQGFKHGRQTERVAS